MLILCVCVRWQPLDRTLGNAYTHNDRSSSRLSGLSSLVLLSFNCYLHGSKREAIYIHNCNFRGPNTSGGNHQSLLTEDSEHTRTGLRPDKMMIFHLVDRRILSVYRKNLFQRKLMYFILKLYWQTVLGILALVLALLFVFLLFPQIVLGDGVRDIGADERKICRDPLHPIHNNKLLSRPRKEKRNTCGLFFS